MKIQEALKYALDSENVEEAESLLNKVGENKYKEAIPVLINYLKSTENHRIRNAIALALSDIGDEKAVKPLIEMINDSKTLGYRGSLLYALKPFDCSAYLETLVYHLLTGNYEVQLNSFELIEENINSSISDEVLLNSILKVKNELDEIERQKEIFTDALEILFSLKKI
ncbi:tetratricopeptide (TPR) repeat protein [Bacillus sp. SORGH_AS 510]|uniref:HEAT repeat domain-containing protein n=1 Tax=Bacillus sp. SORGH_AS_0510 TaxID=3041771 RepID=UPI002787D555|nr:HEAT repeat domain-containing protein [Bacillus sp. SORGH_AS_0510]MDQ1146124.1 tetratricopeptide (TPR) repeat protein [Bacillus sp. SORGH_AS_0510]